MDHFAYTTYIAASASTVWKALTDPDQTAQYWDHRNISDFQEGSQWTHERVSNPGVLDAQGIIRKAFRNNALEFTFEKPEDYPSEHPTWVSLVLSTLPGQDGLTKVQLDQYDCPSEEDYHAIELGWPAVLSNLKTLCETGKPLDESLWTLMLDDEL